MSEGIQGKEIHQGSINKKEEQIDSIRGPDAGSPPSLDQSELDAYADSGEGIDTVNIGPEILSTLLVERSSSTSVRGVVSFNAENYLFSDLRAYVQTLVESTTKGDHEVVLQETNKILDLYDKGRKISNKLQCQILSALISTLFEADITPESKSWRQRAFHSHVSSLFLGRNPTCATIVCTSLQYSAVNLEEDLGNISEKFLVTCSHLLLPSDSIGIAAAVVQGSSSKKNRIRAGEILLQTVHSCFNKIKRHPGGVAALLNEESVEHLLFILATHEPFTDFSPSKAAAQDTVLKLASLFPSSQIKMEQRNECCIESDCADASTIIDLLADIGPACTSNTITLRDTLREVSKSGNTSSITLNESIIARLIFFFAEKSSTSVREDDGLSLALLGSLLPSSLSSNSEDVTKDSGWDLDTIAQVLSEDYSSPHLNWGLVASSFDFPDFMLRDSSQLKALLRLYRAGANADLPSSSFLNKWTYESGQLSLLEQLLTSSTQTYIFDVSKEEAIDAALGDGCLHRGWASPKVLRCLLSLFGPSHTSHLESRVGDLFVKGLRKYPGVLLCSLVRFQVNASSADEEILSGSRMLVEEITREFTSLYFEPTNVISAPHVPETIKRLWNISPSSVTQYCIQAWNRSDPDSTEGRKKLMAHFVAIIKWIPDSVDRMLKDSIDTDLNIALAFVLSDNDFLQMKPWLKEMISTRGEPFVISLIAYLGRNYASARRKTRDDDDDDNSSVNLDNIALSLQFLQKVDRSILTKPIPSASPQGREFISTPTSTIYDSLKGLTEACLAQHPELKAAVASPGSSVATLTASGMHNSNADEIEELANSYFQKIYTSEHNIGEVVEMLKRYKVSGNALENDVFACMIHNLFDEYRFFSKYPEKELRITGILFGTLIQNQLVGSITLGIALRYVLEALRMNPHTPTGNTTSPNGKMFRFGMFALEQFKSRLHEWPQYCSHLLLLPHLKENYAELVAEIEGAMTDSQPRGPSLTVAGNHQSSELGSASRSDDTAGTDTRMALNTNNSVPSSNTPAVTNTLQTQSCNLSSGTTPSTNLSVNMENLSLTLPVPPTRNVAVFGRGLGRAVKGEIESPETQHESPPDSILDRVQFLINNVSPSNVEQKAHELKDILSPTFFGWLGNYLVVKRISTQPNFHSLYLAFLDQLGDYGKGLVEAILSSVYVNIGSLLRSPKITISTAERSLLKNLGSWLGQITLARNRPILQVMLDCKELLFQGYETGMLIAVTPFVAKILEGAKTSLVFRPPNPWLMGLLSVFRALYGVEDLKMNIKFEVEVLCKNLSVKLEDIPLRKDDLAKRIPPMKDRNPDFNIKSGVVAQPQGGAAGQYLSAQSTGSVNPNIATASQGSSSPDSKQHRSGQVPTNMNHSVTGITSNDVVTHKFATSPIQGSNGAASSVTSSFQDQQKTLIPNLESYVTINQRIFQQSSWSSSLNITGVVLKSTVPIAVDRAIREIIQPVVERSVTIALITTKEIVTKDYAMESDENKMLKAAQLMVANLAGSLALVTCREPLRGSMSTHLRQLLTSNVLSGDGRTANASQLTDQEHNAIEECVSTCASDNLELGCMLIEKAATEKAVRDMNETLAPALSERRKHREQTGQPFYDMSIFGNDNHRYPAALPEPLRPKPGGLRNEQLLVYDAFQRMPRQPVAPSSQVTSSASSSGSVIGSPSGSVSGRNDGSVTSPSLSGRENANILPNNLSKLDDALSSGNPGGVQQRVGLDVLSTIAGKLDVAVTALLSSVGSRASEITLSILPPENEIKQLLVAVQRVAASATSTGIDGARRMLNAKETEAVLKFAQSIFKRLYDLSLTEPLRIETLVALLEGLNEFCPQLGQDLGTWATYAPTETEGQRKIHLTVLLLLVRSRLIPIAELDVFLAKSMDGGRNTMWVEFSIEFLRNALLERITLSSDTPKVIENLKMIGEGRSQTGLQISFAKSKQILLFLDEIRANDQLQQQQQQPSQSHISSKDPRVLQGHPDLGIGNRSHLTHQQSSSIGAVSLNNLADATRKAADALESTSNNDPPGIRQQVTFLLDSWIRVNNEALGSEKALAQYLQLLQQHGIGKIEEQTERFFRISTELVIESALKSVQLPNGTRLSNDSIVMNYSAVDAYAKLIALLIRYMNGGGTPEQVATQRISLLNKVLGVSVRTLMSNYEKSKQPTSPNIPHWDQRPWFRLLLNLVHDLNSPSPALDSISYGILSVFGSAFHIVQPLVVPGFAFAWLELISHRMFLSNLLLLKGQKGWGIAHQLLIDLFLFLEPHLRKTELTEAIKHLYKGTLRVLLVLLHDFPSFLSGYHLSFCNVIPENCVQMRHLILSAFPRGMVLPDPFTPNLKIDLLTEISQSPAVLSNVTGPLAGMRADLDGFLKSRQPSNFVSSLLPRLYKKDTKDVDAARVNSLVLYVGMQAIARLHNMSQIAHTPEMEVIQELMNFDDRGRYISLNAIANQLRFPSSHTHYYSCVMLVLFSEGKDEGVKEQVTRVLLERLIVHRPHPWGLLITFIELIKNQRYQFWSHQFTRCATEIEKVFESVARSCMSPEGQRAVTTGDKDTQ